MTAISHYSADIFHRQLKPTKTTIKVEHWLLLFNAQNFRILWDCMYCEHPPTCCPNVNKPRKKMRELLKNKSGSSVFDWARHIQCARKLWIKMITLIFASLRIWHIEMSSLQMKRKQQISNEKNKKYIKRWLNMVAIFICTFVHFIVSQTSARSRTKWRLENALQSKQQKKGTEKLLMCVLQWAFWGQISLELMTAMKIWLNGNRLHCKPCKQTANYNKILENIECDLFKRFIAINKLAASYSRICVHTFEMT